MAYTNKLIRNTKTGQDILFLRTAKDTSGQLLEMLTTYHAASQEPPLHYHPRQKEAFFVVEGQIQVRMGKELKIVKAGETLQIPENTVHSMWNPSQEKAVVRWTVYPALNTENFLETAVGVAVNGKTNASGIPSILQAALMAQKYSNVFRLARPPFPVQMILFLLLSPLAYLRGYRPSYDRYLD